MITVDANRSAPASRGVAADSPAAREREAASKAGSAARLMRPSALDGMSTRGVNIACRSALTLLCTYSSLAQASEWTFSGIVGAGNHVGLAGVEARWPTGLGGALSDQWSWSVSLAGDVAYWWASSHAGSSPSLWEMGLSPVIGLRHPGGTGLSYYVEGGIGIHLLSHTRIDDRDLSTAFQFGEFAGTGVNFGEHEEYGIGVGIQHISNGRIKEPNSGATFGEVRISYRWD